MVTRKKKTLLVGFDAACWEYLDPLLEKGQLPALKRLMTAGVSGVLHSTMPALTPVAWSSIITGKNPGKHGIYDMTYRRQGSYDFLPVGAHRRRGAPFWQRLNEHGIRVGLVNVPFTYPADPLEGFVVGGFGTPDAAPDVTYPAEARQRIEAKQGAYSPSVSPHVLRSGRYADILAAEEGLQAYQVQAATELADYYQVDVLVINLMALDHVNHLTPDMDWVTRAIGRLDADLERLLAEFQPDNVMVISDHGARRVKGDFLLHAWLQDQGYAVRVKRLLSEQSLALNWVLKQWLQIRGWSGSFERICRRLARSLVPRLPEKTAQSFWQRLEKDIPFARNHVLFSDRLDYSQTRVFTGASYSSILYFNREAREPNGIVSLHEREHLAAELCDKLSHIKDPDTGEPLFSNIHQASDIFHGVTSEAAPDLVIDSYRSSWNILSTFRRGAYAEAVRNRYFVKNIKDFGHHGPDGIFVFAGPDFRTGAHEAPGHLADVPATLLHLYDVPIPDDYDGRSLTHLLPPEFLAAHPLRTQPGDAETTLKMEDSYSEKETAAIVEHLRALGYVD